MAWTIEDLEEHLDFPGLSFRHAMEFLLSDGIIPESDLPVPSILALEDWARAQSPRSGW